MCLVVSCFISICAPVNSAAIDLLFCLIYVCVCVSVYIISKSKSKLSSLFGAFSIKILSLCFSFLLFILFIQFYSFSIFLVISCFISVCSAQRNAVSFFFALKTQQIYEMPFCWNDLWQIANLWASYWMLFINSLSVYRFLLWAGMTNRVLKKKKKRKKKNAEQRNSLDRTEKTKDYGKQLPNALLFLL